MRIRNDRKTYDALGRRVLPEGAAFPDVRTRPLTLLAVKRITADYPSPYNLRSFIDILGETWAAHILMEPTPADRAERAVFEDPEGEIVGGWVPNPAHVEIVGKAWNSRVKHSFNIDYDASVPYLGTVIEPMEIRLYEFRSLTDDPDLNRYLMMVLSQSNGGYLRFRCRTGSSRFTTYFQAPATAGQAVRLPIPEGARLCLDGVPVMEFRSTPENRVVLTGVTGCGEALYWSTAAGLRCNTFAPHALKTLNFNGWEETFGGIFGSVSWRAADGSPLSPKSPAFGSLHCFRTAHEKAVLLNMKSNDVCDLAEMRRNFVPSVWSDEFWLAVLPCVDDLERKVPVKRKGVPERSERERTLAEAQGELLKRSAEAAKS